MTERERDEASKFVQGIITAAEKDLDYVRRIVHCPPAQHYHEHRLKCCNLLLEALRQVECEVAK